jgi:ABC-2 type transport system ATP-binding protein
VVDHGRVIARGDARALKRQVGGAQLFATVANPARLEEVRAHVGRVAGAEPAADPDSRTVQAPTGDGPRAVSALADALSDDGIEVEDIGLRQPTLDDVFLTLTGTAIAEEQPVEVAR